MIDRLINLMADSFIEGVVSLSADALVRSLNKWLIVVLVDCNSSIVVTWLITLLPRGVKGGGQNRPSFRSASRKTQVFFSFFLSITKIILQKIYSFLICPHPPPLQLSSKKKLFLGIENIGGEFSPLSYPLCIIYLHIFMFVALL